MGFFEDLIEGFFKVIGAIVEGIRKVFLVLEDIVVFIGTEILPIVAIVFSAITLSVAALAIFFPAAATAIVNFFVYGTYALQAANIGVLNTGPVAVNISMQTLKTVMATFLKMIHFDTIMAIHNIAWVLSEDYRKVLRKLFKSMSEVSEAIFGWSLGMRVILENSRSIIMTSSQALGYPYDVSQLIWLNTMTDTVVKINDNAERYMEDPEQFFFDLEEWIDKNAIDISGGAHGLIYDAVRTQTDALEATTKTVIDIQSRSRQNQMKVRALTGQNLDWRIKRNQGLFSGFKNDEYAPLQKQQNESIEMNRTQTDRNRQETSRLAIRLRSPSGQIDGVDDLSEPDKSQEEIKLEDLTTRPYQAENETLATEQDAATDEHDKDLAESEMKTEQELIEEQTEPKQHEPVKVKTQPPVNSWFVGDY